MINIAILVPETAIVEAVADPHYMFTVVNQFLQQAGQKPLFNIFLVAQEKEIFLNGSLFMVRADKSLDEVGKVDLIIVPAISGDIKKAIQLNEKIVLWLKQQHQKGAAIASLCIGAFLLASTGLLNKKQCSTHWSAANEFRQMFPEVQLADGSVITEDNGIYTSGGANSYWTLLLHLVEQYTNRATAILASKYFAVDIDRNSQSVFSIFQGQKDHKDDAIIMAQKHIEQFITDKISIDDLAAKVNLGRRSFERRFKLATNHTVLAYMQKVKVEAAKRSFENSRNNINEVMYEVGYSDSKAFRSVFKKITGLTPIDYRNKYNKLALKSEEGN